MKKSILISFIIVNLLFICAFSVSAQGTWFEINDINDRISPTPILYSQQDQTQQQPYYYNGQDMLNGGGEQPNYPYYPYYPWNFYPLPNTDPNYYPNQEQPYYYPVPGQPYYYYYPQPYPLPYPQPEQPYYPYPQPDQPYYQTPLPPGPVYPKYPTQEPRVEVNNQWMNNGTINMTWTIHNTTREDWGRSNVDIKCIEGCWLLTDSNRTLWDIPYTVKRNERLSFTVNIWQPMSGDKMTFAMVAGSKTLYRFDVYPF